MKLRNKKTGEIGYLYDRSLLQDIIIVYDVKGIVGKYRTITKLCKEWQDYEEPKGYYYVTTTGLIKYDDTPFCAIHKDRKEIGNYFETEEEAEKAVEKLKAWKRLKDKGFKLDGWENDQSRTLGDFVIYANIKCLDDIVDDLNLLFGSEE